MDSLSLIIGDGGGGGVDMLGFTCIVKEGLHVC